MMIANGCKEKANSVMVLKIDNKTNGGNIMTLPKNMIKHISFVSLETTKESLLPSEPRQFFATKDRFIFADKGSKGSVWIFDNNGKFITRIKATGEGPREYASIRNVFVDTFNSKVVLFANSKETIISYDFYGKALEEKAVDIIYDAMHKSLDGNTYFYIPNFSMNIINSEIIRKDTKGKYKGLSNKKHDNSELGVTLSQTNIFSNSEGTFFSRALCDTIFKISSSGLFPYRILSFSKNPIPPNFDEQVKEKRSSRLTFAFENNHPIVQDFYFETTKYIYMTYIYNRRSFFFLHRKSNNQSIINADRIYLDHIGLNLPSPKYHLNSGVVFLVNPLDLKKMISQSDASKVAADLVKISNSSTNDDNPILIMVEFF